MPPNPPRSPSDEAQKCGHPEGDIVRVCASCLSARLRGRDAEIARLTQERDESREAYYTEMRTYSRRTELAERKWTEANAQLAAAAFVAGFFVAKDEALRKLLREEAVRDDDDPVLIAARRQARAALTPDAPKEGD